MTHRTLFQILVELAPVVQTLDSAIRRINHYPADSVIGFPNTYPLDSDLSGGQRYPTFEQLGPDGFKYSFFNRVVDKWNGLPNHIRESNSIATFKRNVLSFIKDNQNIYISICTYFSYILISGDLVWPQYGALALWLSPSPQLFFFLIVVIAYFIACNVVE